MTRFLSILLTLAVGASALATDEYRLDDGVPESNFGIAGGGSGPRRIAWLNRFVVEPGKEIITGVRVAFGDVPNGIGADVLIWYDPDQDGDPDDAVFLTGLSAGTVNASPTLPVGWADFDTPDVALLPGDIIFAGIIMEIDPSDLPARLDIDGSDQPVISYPPSNHSYIAGDTVNPINPSAMGMAQLPVAPVGAALGVDGNWLIRLNAAPILVPCPADLNGDRVVNGADLAILLAAWNTGGADLNHDGATDGADLAILLAAWGPCP